LKRSNPGACPMPRDNSCNGFLFLMKCMLVSDKTSETVTLLHKKVKYLLKEGKQEDYIIEELKKDGISLEYAHIIIANVYNDMYDRKSFWKLIFGGLFFIAGGLVINYFSYQVAANAGSFFYYLFWGIVVGGIVMIIRAFVIFKK